MENEWIGVGGYEFNFEHVESKVEILKRMLEISQGLRKERANLPLNSNDSF